MVVGIAMLGIGLAGGVVIMWLYGKPIKEQAKRFTDELERELADAKGIIDKLS